MRTAKFFSKKGVVVKAKFGDLKYCHLSLFRKHQPVTLPKLCKEMAKKGFYRPNDPRLTH